MPFLPIFVSFAALKNRRRNLNFSCGDQLIHREIALVVDFDVNLIDT